MSYILDALRRADSERERGQIPGIHAHPVAPQPPDESSPGGISPRAWGAAAAGALLSGALAWWWMSGERASGAPATAPAAAAAAAMAVAPVPASVPVPAPVAAPVPALAPAPLPAAVIAQPRQGAAGATDSTPTTPPTLPAVATSRPAADKTAAPAEPRDSAAPAATPPRAAPDAAARSTPAVRGGASAAVAAQPRVMALHELPEEVRRAVPPLVVNGSVYSKNPADRFLIVNGQIVHESDTVAPDLVVERIGPRSAVLGIHGHRFEIGY
jgi:general secretion pathway protein B